MPQLLMQRCLSLILWLFIFCFTALAAPALRVLTQSQSGISLLANGDFEALQDNTVAPWRAWNAGFTMAAGAGRNGSRAVMCENTAGQGEYGAYQTLLLNRAAAAPIIVRGWSKAEKVSGSPDSGYSLYIDIVYNDDTPLWGQTANFRTGTHDWQQGEVVILPDKPVKSLNVYCLFRGHSGKVWFDDIRAEETRAQNGAVFQGVPVQVVKTALPKNGKSTNLATQDGLKITLHEGAVK